MLGAEIWEPSVERQLVRPWLQMICKIGAIAEEDKEYMYKECLHCTEGSRRMWNRGIKVKDSQRLESVKLLQFTQETLDEHKVFENHKEVGLRILEWEVRLQQVEKYLVSNKKDGMAAQLRKLL